MRSDKKERINEKAQKHDWETEKMPLETETFSMEIELSESEYEQLQNGIIPQEMEDKWFIYFEEDTLYIHRSWTGFCIYILEFPKDFQKSKRFSVIVNRNVKQHLETDIEKDKIMITILINQLVNRFGNGELMKQYLQKNI